MPLEGFTPYAKKDAKKYNRLRWWLGMTWGDLFDKATDIYPDKIGWSMVRVAGPTGNSGKRWIIWRSA